ncbi:hypothetical protein Ocin01_18895 [Orchesella cincta]|uniref:DUF243 domain-containing protein n=1 Tax=Orchesella cincta TaxID=48709 RepID=A0A1D2M484_ORCCI|nr:hypothetical protein Ocin01_18895 [Orchesella cincta]
MNTAPDEPARSASPLPSVFQAGDKHLVNIIFCQDSNPNPAQQQTESFLPDNRRAQELGPQAQRPTKPEVYFIRYKGQEQEQQQGGGNGGYQQGPQTGGISQVGSVGPAPVRNNGNNNNVGNNNGYSQAGGYSPAVAPGPIRSQSDVPSSGYGVPL